MTSIQEAMESSSRLLDSAELGTVSPKELKTEVQKLLASSLSARGFMAALATRALPEDAKIRQAILAGIKAGRENSYELIVKNIIMSNCAALDHEKNNRRREALGSRATVAASLQLAELLNDHELAVLADGALKAIESWCSCLDDDKEILISSTVDPIAKSWFAFFERWGYSKSSLNTVAVSLQPATQTK